MILLQYVLTKTILLTLNGIEKFSQIFKKLETRSYRMHLRNPRKNPDVWGIAMFAMDPFLEPDDF